MIGCRLCAPTAMRSAWMVRAMSRIVAQAGPWTWSEEVQPAPLPRPRVPLLPVRDGGLLRDRLCSDLVIWRPLRRSQTPRCLDHWGSRWLEPRMPAQGTVRPPRPRPRDLPLTRRKQSALAATRRIVRALTLGPPFCVPLSTVARAVTSDTTLQVAARSGSVETRISRIGPRSDAKLPSGRPGRRAAAWRAARRVPTRTARAALVSMFPVSTVGRR